MTKITLTFRNKNYLEKAKKYNKFYLNYQGFHTFNLDWSTFNEKTMELTATKVGLK